MIARRTFNFAVLLGLCSSVIPARAEKPRLSARYTAVRTGEILEITLHLTNLSSEPISIVTMRGANPGVALSVLGKGHKADPLRQITAADALTRAGPRPIVESLAGGAERQIGPYRFALGPTPPKQVTIEGWVDLTAGEQLALPPVEISTEEPSP